MTAAFTRLASSSTKTAGTTIAQAITAPASGAALVVVLAMDPTSGTVSCTDSTGGTYTKDADVTNGSGTSGVRTVVFSRANITNAPTSVTVTLPSTTDKAMEVWEVAGLITSGAIADKVATGTGSTSAVSAPAFSAATAQADEYLFLAVGWEASSTTMAPASATNSIAGTLTKEGTGGNGTAAGNNAITTSGGSGASNMQAAGYDQTVAATGAYGASLTGGASANWAAALVSYKAIPTQAPNAPTTNTDSSVWDTRIVARWSPPTVDSTHDAATGYRLDVATDSGFTSLLSGYNNLDVGVRLAYPVTGLSASTTYYYRVRAYNSAGTSASTAGRSLTTLAALPSGYLGTVLGTAGLVSCYPLDEASGATYVKDVWSGYDLDVVGSPTLGATSIMPGVAGTAVTFATSNANALLQRAPQTGLEMNGSGQSFSVEFWTKPTTVTWTGFADVVAAEDYGTGGRRGWGFSLDSAVAGTIKNQFYNNGAVFLGEVDFVVTAGNVFHVVTRYNASTLAADGKLNNGAVTGFSGTPSFGSYSQPLTVGAKTEAATSVDYYPGTLQFVAIYNAVVSDADVAAHYTAGTSTSTANTRDTVARFRLLAAGLRDTLARFALRSATAYRDTAARLRIAAPPNAPTLNALTNTGNYNWFTASWSAPATDANHSAATGYKVTVSTNSAFTAPVVGYSGRDVGNVTSLDILGLAVNTAYWVRVVAYNSAGDGAASGSQTATTATGSDALSGLVHYWRLDEASGNRADANFGTALVPTNAPTQVAGKIGQAAHFLASGSQRLDGTNPSLFFGPRGFQISGWAYHDHTSGGETLFVAYSAVSGHEACEVYTDGAGHLLFYIEADDGTNTTTQVAIPSDVSTTYFYFDAWYTGGPFATINIRINGGTPASVSWSSGARGDIGIPLNLGGIWAPWDGAIDALGLWLTDPGDTVRAAVYNGGAGLDYPFVPAGPTLRDTAARFRLAATGVRDAAARFRLRATAYRDTVARLALRSPAAYRDAAGRFRLSILVRRDAAGRFLLRSASKAVDAAARLRVAILSRRDTGARLAIRSVATYRDTASRLALRSPATLRDGASRLRLASAPAYRNTVARLLVRALAYRDATSRLALRSVSTSRDTVARARLAALGARDTVARLRLDSPATYRDTVQRLRLAALGVRDTLARLRLVSPVVLRDTAARHRLVSPALYRDAAARLRLVTGLARDTGGRFRLSVLAYRATAARLAVRSALVARDTGARARLAGLSLRDTGARFRLGSPATYRDLAARFRQGSALLVRDTSARARLAATGTRDTGLRLAVVASGVFRDTGARLALRATALRDGAARFRASAGPVLRDTAGRVRLAGLVLRDAGGRFLLRPGQASRPVSDATVGNWTTDAGATTGLYARINEVAPDFASYIQSPANPQAEPVTLHCGPLNDPGINTGYRVGIGYQVDTVGAVMNVRMDLIAGGVTFATRTFAGLPSNQTLDTVFLTSGEVDAMRANGGFAGFDVRFTATQTG